MAADRPNELRRVQVVAVRREAADVLAYDLAAADGRPLPLYAPGAHIDVHVPGGPVRQYSLCGDPCLAETYTIAVKREAEGRGGSIGMHDGVQVGSVLAMAGPKNNFPLADDAVRSVLIAGGIGITPIRPMIHSLQRTGRAWELHYCARSRRHAAFYDALRALSANRVHGYFGEGSGSQRLDAGALVHEYVPGTHLYCCGPERLMTAVAATTGHWPEGHVHFEWFRAPAARTDENQAFEVELRRSAVSLEVPANLSILQVLRAHGYDLPSSCEEGVCGTCETRVLAGTPDHRDMLLSSAERTASKTMMICVSRSKSERLVLDL